MEHERAETEAWPETPREGSGMSINLEKLRQMPIATMASAEDELRKQASTELITRICDQISAERCKGGLQYRAGTPPATDADRFERIIHASKR